MDQRLGSRGLVLPRALKGSWFGNAIEGEDARQRKSRDDPDSQVSQVDAGALELVSWKQADPGSSQTFLTLFQGPDPAGLLSRLCLGASSRLWKDSHL